MFSGLRSATWARLAAELRKRRERAALAVAMEPDAYRAVWHVESSGDRGVGVTGAMQVAIALAKVHRMHENTVPPWCDNS